MDRTAEKPLHQQITEQIRSAVHTGGLRARDAIPASRQLAQQLGVSRAVVLEAYEQLRSEGYLCARHGAGTFVNSVAADAPGPAGHADAGPRASPPDVGWTSAPVIPSPRDHARETDVLDLRPNIPDLRRFPLSRWQRALVQACQGLGALGLERGCPQGSPRLRDEIARHLRLTRAVPVTADQVVVTNGTSDGLELTTALLLRPGDTVLTEDPLPPAARAVLDRAGARAIAVPVDAAGMRTQDIGPRLRECGVRPDEVRALYLAPQRQPLTGALLSARRREWLARWAEAHRATVVEVDYCGEFCAPEEKLPAIAGMAPANTIHVGSFTKTMFPALGMGYLAMPTTTAERLLDGGLLASRRSSPEQEAMADFLASGAYSRHVANMARLYRGRLDRTLDALRRLGSGLLRPYTGTGLHLMVDVDRPRTEVGIAEAALAHGVRVHPVSAHYRALEPGLPAFLLGYGAVPEDRLEEGVRRLVRALGG
uniref:Putative GntR transcriptional regulator/aminotransferase n=1 Tax=Streptoalloteichus sp. ATCC 53650 TaxID=756733 RepID=K4NYE1_9PSEU|nr:putative GntR transcriptional regulator/aminotransferase [Streptoalloteichus sp. ATCC 53650]